MPNPLSISDAADLVDLSIQDIFLKGSEKESRLFEQYFNVETGVVDYYVKDSSLSGLGYAGRIAENAAVTAASPVQGFDKTYTQVQYGVLLSFTKMMWFFGIKKRNLERITNEARRACTDLRELRCADRLDNSFSTSYTAADISGNYSVTITGGDGLAYITATHTREDGGTSWSNRVTDGSTVNMDWEYDALKAAHRTAALQLGPTGKPLNVNLDTFVCSRGYSVHNRALEILGAINKGWIPASADREGPAVAAYKILALPWITTNTLYWWMYDSSMKNDSYGLQYKEAQSIDLEGPNLVFKTGEIQYKASLIFDLGFGDARGWCGSKNTNAA
ncbi:MAG: hypothetical protein AAB721_01620 [Patescibacteria group bacterium]